jgi:hypothetical protein
VRERNRETVTAPGNNVANPRRQDPDALIVSQLILPRKPDNRVKSDVDATRSKTFSSLDYMSTTKNMRRMARPTPRTQLRTRDGNELPRTVISRTEADRPSWFPQSLPPRKAPLGCLPWLSHVRTRVDQGPPPLVDWEIALWRSPPIGDMCMCVCVFYARFCASLPPPGNAQPRQRDVHLAQHGSASRRTKASVGCWICGDSFRTSRGVAAGTGSAVVSGGSLLPLAGSRQLSLPNPLHSRAGGNTTDSRCLVKSSATKSKRE